MATVTGAARSPTRLMRTEEKLEDQRKRWIGKAVDILLSDGTMPDLIDIQPFLLS